MTRPLAAACLLLAACATTPPPPPPAAPPPAAPAADRLARLAPFDRAAVEVEGELVRLATIPDLPAAAGGGRGRGGAAPTGPGIVAVRETGGTIAYSYVGSSAGYRDGLLARVPGWREAAEKARQSSDFHRPVKAAQGAGDAWCVLDKVPAAAGPSPAYRLILTISDRDPRATAGASPGKVGKKESMRLEVEAKLAAAGSGSTASILELTLASTPDGRPQGSLGLGTAPVAGAGAARGALVQAVSPGGPAERAGLRPGDVVVGVDRQPVGSPEELARTLSGRAPATVVTLSVQRGGERLEAIATLAARASSPAVLRRPSAIVTIGDAWLGQDGRLEAISFPAWQPSSDFFLQGKTSKAIWPELDRATEQAINDAVVEWKTRQLPGWLRQASAEQLEASIISTEKGILALDLAVRSVKDRIDAAVRNKETAFASAGEIEQLLEQRKMLLGVVLQAIKGAAAQKVR